MGEGQPKAAIMIVAHPDDETLWGAGLLFARRDVRWRVVSLCRGSDPDRASRFREALRVYGAEGEMADLDDGPEQSPLDGAEVRGVVCKALGDGGYDLVVSHGLRGEYTRHRRHEEAHEAVAALWREGTISARAFWFFAYDDEGGRRLPACREEAHQLIELSREAWEKKLWIVTEVYGFAPESWEVRTTPRREGFWCFEDVQSYEEWKQEELRRS